LREFKLDDDKVGAVVGSIFLFYFIRYDGVIGRYDIDSNKYLSTSWGLRFSKLNI
jgi:hypothetical protein